MLEQWRFCLLFFTVLKLFSPYFCSIKGVNLFLWYNLLNFMVRNLFAKKGLVLSALMGPPLLEIGNQPCYLFEHQLRFLSHLPNWTLFFCWDCPIYYLFSALRVVGFKYVYVWVCVFIFSLRLNHAKGYSI